MVFSPEDNDLLSVISRQVPGVIYQFQRLADGTSSMPFATDKLAEIFELNPEEVCETAAGIFKKIHPEDLKLLEKSIDASQDTLGNWEYEFRIIASNGNVRWLNGLAKPERQNDGSTLWHGYMLDITDRKHREAEAHKMRHLLNDQLGFQQLLAGISTGFVNATQQTFNDTVIDSLEKIGKFFHSDRCYVFLFSDDYFSMSNTHEWCENDIAPQIMNLQNFTVGNMPWWWEQVKNKKQINIPDVSRHQYLSANEKSILHDQGVQSLLCIPMINNGALMGFLGLDRVKQRKGWGQEQINQFNVLGEIISSVFAKSKAEGALMRSESQYRLLAENARDMIYRIALKPNLHFEYVSPASEIITGYTPEEHYQNPFLYEKISSDDALKTFLKMLKKPGEIFSNTFLFRLKHKKGFVVWVELKNVPVFENNELIAIEGIARDITLLKTNEDKLNQLYQQLIKKKEQLETLNLSLEQRIAEEVEKNRQLDHMVALQARQAALGEMIGNIAHQWRQPLNLLSLAVYDMADAFQFQELDEKYMENSVEEITTIIQQMSKTIDDFRNYFKPQTEKNLFQVRETINNAIAFVSPYFHAMDVKIEKDLPENIHIMGYSSQFEQVLISLFKNALYAMQVLKPEKRIVRVKSRRIEPNTAKIEVFNYGNLIKDEHLPRIFDPYFSTKPEGKGLGLGLFIAKMIVETNMNGKIYCENKNNGVSFFIELDLTEPE